MTRFRMDFFTRTLIAALLVATSGCATQNKSGSKEKPQSEVSPSSSSVAGTAALGGAVAASPKSSQQGPAPGAKPENKSPLAEGIDLYEAGKYSLAIRRLNGATEIWKGSEADQLTALKYMAFSYCLSNRKDQCRRHFARALAIDPAFDLHAGEKGHPLWTPQFEKAKEDRESSRAAKNPKKK